MNTRDRGDDADLSLRRIRQALQLHSPRRAELLDVARAGVAMVLRELGPDTEVLLIRRAERADDPWSGHVALPGGRQQPQDPDVVAAALRETREEVGLDLERDARLLGRLDDLPAIARDRPVGLVISPVVCELTREAELLLDRREVESALWVPLRELRSSTARSTHRRRWADIETDFPALQYREFTIWGLTYQILQDFLRLF